MFQVVHLQVFQYYIHTAPADAVVQMQPEPGTGMCSHFSSTCKEEYMPALWPLLGNRAPSDLIKIKIKFGLATFKARCRLPRPAGQ